MDQDFRVYDNPSEASSEGSGARKALAQEFMPDRVQLERTVATSTETNAWSSVFGSSAELSAQIARFSVPVAADPVPPPSPRPPQAPPASQIEIPAWALQYRQGGQNADVPAWSQPGYPSGPNESQRDSRGSGFADPEPRYAPGGLPYRPRLDTPQPPEARDFAEAAPTGLSGQGYAGLRRAIERARQGGEPVRVLHYGASHTVAGTEAGAFEGFLEQSAPVDYYRQAKNGISATYPLSRTQEWLDQPIRQTNPDLIVVEFGNNDGAVNINPKAYEEQFDKLISEIKRRAPNASIMIMGPTDGCSIRGANKGNLLPGLTDVIDVQKKVAARYGIDYYDVRQDMGGAGSVYEWRERGLVSSDLLHFTSAGYKQLGLMRYEHLRSRINS